MAVQEKRLLVSIVDELAAQKSEVIYAEYPVSATTYDEGFRKITFPEFANAINGVAWWLHDTIGPGKNFETLAYIGVLDIRYNALLLGAVKAGYKVLLASPRNSIPAHVNLFNLLDCKIMVSPNPRPQAVTAITASHNLRILEIPSVEELLDISHPHYPYDKSFEETRKEPLVVLHTSGTTGLPKPIVWTHDFAASWLQWFRMDAPAGYVNTYTIWSPGRLFFTFPPFHAAAMFGSILSAIYNQTTIIYPLAGVIPSAQVIVDGLKHTKAGCAAIAPLFVEEISKKPELLDFLSKHLDSIFYSGGSVSAAVGNTISQKMKFYTVMGTTECGLYPTLHPAEQWPAGGWSDWNYIRFNPGGLFELRKVSGDEYEAVIVRDPDPEKEQSVFKVFPEKNEYGTGDLYTPHPTKPDLWLYRGRADDIIVFLTGEKTNPISMEESIARHPEVRSVLVMGTLRFQAALLVELTTEEKLSTSDKAKAIERLWPVIQEANADCPRHAQVKKSHILFTEPDKPMQRAGKGTIQRRPTLDLYSKEIDQLYADADKASAADATDDDSGKISIDIRDSEAVSSFISESVTKFMDTTAISDEDNFFLSGMDSLQALQLTRKLKASLAIPDLGVSTVYANPSNSLLAKAIVELSDQHEVSAVLKQSLRVKGLEEVLQEYKAQIDEFASSQKAESPMQPLSITNGTVERVVLLTGSTGAIGSYILQVLLDTPSVSHIYCLNRGPDSASLQGSRNKARGLPTEFTEERVSFLTADVGKENLGLEIEVYAKLRSSTTDIIHNAWPVNFNMSLSTFRPHLTGVVNLIKLAASTSHVSNILFISSISSVLASPVSPIPEKIITDPLVTLPMGYGESKYLAERILDYASTVLSGINTNIARVGQVAGPAYAPGSWNKWEWFPSLVTSSLHLGIVPDSLGKGDTVIEWVPIDVLAGALVELTLGSKSDGEESGAKVFHPVNRHPTTWNALRPIVVKALNNIVAASGQAITITEAPLVTWVECVRDSAAKLDGASGLEEMLQRNPAIKLLAFYEGLLIGDGVPDVEGKRALEGSEKLRELEGLRSEWLERWIGNWIKA